MDSFEDILLSIKSETASMLLADLMDEEKRTPQLYNAIIKFLEMNKNHIVKYMDDDSDTTDQLEDILSQIPDLPEQYNIYHIK